MELFVINRYLGEDPNTKQVNEAELKQKWLSKIEERRKIRENALSETQVSSTVNETSNTFELEDDEKTDKLFKSTDSKKSIKKKKRKRKISEEEGADHHDENTNKLKEDESKSVDNVDDGEEISAESGFLVIGNSEIRKTEKVKRVLPSWLANPSIISVDLKCLTTTVNSISELDEVFTKKLIENNVTHFFPVQAQLIPYLLRNINKPCTYWPSDVCVSAPTGSGKTLAFVLPILQDLQGRIVPQIRTLVVLPVQDLASQVFKVFNLYASVTNLKVLLFKSNTPFKKEQKLLVKQDSSGNYRCLVDIIVTTPGRLVDHLKSTPGLNLEYLKYLVIDEADRVMENIQNDWLFHLNKHIFKENSNLYQAPHLSLETLTTKQRPPQKLLFSATLSQDPEKLQQLGLFQPKLFTSIVDKYSSNMTPNQIDSNVIRGDFVGKFTTPAELQEYYVITSKSTRPLVLHHLIAKKKFRHILCFVKSTESGHRLAMLLRYLSKKEVRVSEISASLPRNKRDIILKNFKSGALDVLISTDSLARGIDIPDVEYVISYEAPKYIKNYIHRVGRTGRAGKNGTAVTFLSSNQITDFQDMLRNAGKSVNEMVVSEDDLESYAEIYQTALGQLKAKLDKNQAVTLKKIKLTKRVKHAPVGSIKKKTRRKRIRRRKSKTVKEIKK